MKIKSITLNAINIIAAIIFCTIIWLHGKFEVSEVDPFVNSLLHGLIILSVILFWLVKLILHVWHRDTDNQLVASFIGATTEINKSSQQNFTHKIEKTLKQLKHQRFLTGKKMKPLHKLPWYIISGPPGYGKTELIKKSGLSFPLLQSFHENDITEEKGLVFECWITEEAVFLELSKIKNAEGWDTTAYNTAWLNVLKTLKKYKSGKPINGMIMVVDISYFMVDSAERHQRIESTRQHLKEIYEQLKAKYAVYIMISKCDSIQGFAEYFQHVGSEERDQAFGFDITISSESIAHLDTILSDEFDKLLKKLTDRLPWLLYTESDLNKKALITFFPQQLFLLKNRFIEVFKKTLFPQNLYELVDLRGVYFCSALQQNTPKYNILDSIIGEQAQLFPVKSPTHTDLGQACFLKNVFTKIIIPSSNPTSDADERSQSRSFFYKILLIGAASIIAINIFMLTVTYFNARHLMLTTEGNIQNFNTAALNFAFTDASLKPLLQLMYPLNVANQSLTVQAKKDYFSFQQHQISEIKTKLQTMMAINLNKLLIPQINARVAQRLNDYEAQPNLLYKAFKAYLYLGNPQNLPKQWLLDLMQYDWSHDAVYSNREQEELNNYLGLALQKIQPITLDSKIIADTLALLQKVPMAEIIYHNIQENTANHDIPIIELLGKDATSLFTPKMPEKIASFYTLSGYKILYLPQLERTLATLAADNKLLATENLSVENDFQPAEVNTLYSQHYITYWQTILTNFEIVPFENINHAVKIIRELKQPQSPLYQLILFIHNNTDVSIGKGDVKNSFADLNTLVTNGASQAGPSISSFTQLLNATYAFLNKIATAPHPNQAAFLIMKASAMGDTSDAISQLNIAAINYPEPIRSWLQQIAQHCWHTLLAMTHTYINDEWDKQVYIKYKNINNFYPLNGNSEFDVNNVDFANFFKFDGVFNHFFLEFINPFINSAQSAWTWYNFNGESLSPNVAALEKLHKMLTVTAYLFANNSLQLTPLNFQLRPITLSDNAAAIHLQIGTQDLLYRHGPLQNFDIVWPTSNMNNIKLSFTNFNDKEASQVFSGAWSFLKLLKMSSIEKTKDNSSYLLLFHLDNFSAKFTCNVANASLLDTLLQLDKLTVPESI